MRFWEQLALKRPLNRARISSHARSLALAVGLTSIGLVNSARAGFSTIQPPLAGNQTQPSILDNIYGGAFTLEGDGVSYTNGTVSAVRVSDFLPSSSSSDNPGPNAADQLWQDSSVTATAKYSSAQDPSSPFGYIPGSSGGSFTSLFNVTGSGYGVTGSDSFVPGASPFRFAAVNTFGVLSTQQSDNKDNKDHVVSYEIDGLGGASKTWLLLFTDFGNNGADAYFDYQNLVVQLNTVPLSSQPSVPEPGSLMVIGGVALGLLKRIPRRVP